MRSSSCLACAFVSAASGHISRAFHKIFPLPDKSDTSTRLPLPMFCGGMC